MKWVCVALLAVCAVLPSACFAPSAHPVQVPRPNAEPSVSDTATSSSGAVSTPRLAFVVAAPQIDLPRLPIGSTLNASDYKVILTGDHVISAKYYVGSMRGGSGGPVGSLDLALDATGTSTMAKWKHDHPGSAVTVLVDGRVLAQSILAKHIVKGKLSLVSTGAGVTIMGQLVASAIRTTP